MNVALRPQPDALNCISLCTGGGGLDLGVELAIPNARVVCMVEREAFAVAHLVEAIEQGLLAPAPIHSDVRTFPGRRFRRLVDLVFGGISCQPYSLAGKRLGAEDERDLWPSARRVLVQSGAWAFLLENVPGMLSGSGGQVAGAERVWRDLRRLGFEVAGGLFTASGVGATQERERLFILAVVNDQGLGRREGWTQHVLRGGRDSPSGPGSDLGAAMERTDRRVCDGRPSQPKRRPIGGTAFGRGGEAPFFPPGPDDVDGWLEYLRHRPDAKPAVRRGSDGLADRTERLRLLGNGVVPLEAADALRTLATDLAARSAGAALLVRMMGDA